MSTLSLRENMLSQVTHQFGRHLGNRWRAGERLPTVRELADELGASHGTVYRALQLMVQNGLLIHKPRQGMFVSPQYTASRFRSTFTQLTPDHAMPAADVLEGKKAAIQFSHTSSHMLAAKDAIESILSSRGCEVTTRPLSKSTVEQDASADVVFLINSSLEHYTPARPDQKVVVVTSAATHPQIAIERYDCVEVQQTQGATLAGRYLREAGCEDICFLGVRPVVNDPASLYGTTAFLRLTGLISGWGKSLPAAHLLTTTFWSPLGGAEAAKVYADLKPRPRGVFAMTDELAMGFASGAEALGLRVGRDFVLVGFDGTPMFEFMREKSLPSVIVPAEKMGHAAVEMLQTRLADPTQVSRTLQLPCTLRTGKPAGGS